MSEASIQRHWILRIARWVVPIAILGAVFWSLDWSKLSAVLRQADWSLLAWALALYIVAVVLQGWRWHVLLCSDGERWPQGRVQVIHFVAMFFDLITPGRLGSDAYRVYAFHRPGKGHHLVSSLVALRLQGMAVSLAAAAVTGFYLLGQKHGWMIVSLVAAALAVFAAVAVVTIYRVGALGVRTYRHGTGIRASIARHTAGLEKAFRSIHRERGTVMRSFVLVVLFLAAVVMVYAAAGWAFGMKLRFASYVAVVPILMVAAILPITHQGRGITELIAIWLWEGPRATREQILLVCLGVYAVAMLQALVAGMIWVALRRDNKELTGDCRETEDLQRAPIIEEATCTNQAG